LDSLLYQFILIIDADDIQGTLIKAVIDLAIQKRGKIWWYW